MKINLLKVAKLMNHKINFKPVVFYFRDHIHLFCKANNISHTQSKFNHSSYNYDSHLYFLVHSKSVFYGEIASPDSDVEPENKN